MSQNVPADTTNRHVTPLDIVRVVVLLVTLVSLGLWGFTCWEAPWNVILGIAAPATALVLWALFLSPRPMLRLHPFLRALVELLIYASVTMAWWTMGQFWIGLGFAIVAIATGLMTGRRALA